MSDVHLWSLIWAISFVCAAINSGCWCWWSGSVAVSRLHPSDHLHGLGRREGAGLRSGPNVLTKVPRSEGILAFQVLCASRKLTPPLPSLHFSRLFAFSWLNQIFLGGGGGSSSLICSQFFALHWSSSWLMMSLNLFTFCQPLGNYDKMKGYQRWCGCGAIDGLAAWLGSDDINGISCEMVERKSLLVNTMSSGPLQIWQIPSVKVWIYLLKCSYRGVHLFDWLTFFPLSHSINSFSALHKYVQLLLKGWDTPILRNLCAQRQIV